MIKLSFQEKPLLQVAVLLTETAIPTSGFPWEFIKKKKKKLVIWVPTFQNRLFHYRLFTVGG